MASFLYLTSFIVCFNTSLAQKLPTDGEKVLKQGILKYMLQNRNRNTPTASADNMFTKYSKNQVIHISEETNDSNIVNVVTKKSILFRRNRPVNVHQGLLASFGTLIRPRKQVRSSRPVFRYG